MIIFVRCFCLTSVTSCTYSHQLALKSCFNIDFQLCICYTVYKISAFIFEDCILIRYSVICSYVHMLKIVNSGPGLKFCKSSSVSCAVVLGRGLFHAVSFRLSDHTHNFTDNLYYCYY